MLIYISNKFYFVCLDYINYPRKNYLHILGLHPHTHHTNIVYIQGDQQIEP